MTESGRDARRVAGLFLASAMVIGVYCAAAAARVWPAVDGDGKAYFPAAVEWSLGRPLTNPVWSSPLTDAIDGPGGRRFIYHGFLYALGVGTLGRGFGGGEEATVKAAYVVHWLAACVTAAAVMSWVAAPGLAGALLAALLPISMLALSVAWHGRMEPLAMLLIGGVCLLWRWLENPWRQFAGGAGAGLLFFTSPMAGVLAGCLLVAALFAERTREAGARGVVAAAVGLVASLSAAVWIFPYSIADWIGGLTRAGQNNLKLAPGLGFGATWLTRPELPLLGLSFAILALAAAPRLVTALGSLGRLPRAAIVLAIGVFVLGLAKFAFAKTEASYVAVVWMPLLACVGFARLRTWGRASLLIAALLLPAVGLTRSALVLATQFAPDAETFRDVRDRIASAAPSGCVVTSGLWQPSADARVTFADLNTPAGRVFIRQQINTGESTPPQFPGYRLSENHYGAGITWLGIPVSRTGGGWGYAVYEADHP